MLEERIKAKSLNQIKDSVSNDPMIKISHTMILSIQYLFKLLHHQSDRAQLNSSKHWWESKKQLLKPICLVRVIIITLMDLVPSCILYANNKILPCLGHWNITSYDWCSMFYTQDVNISPTKNNDIRNVSLELCLDILLVLKFLIKIYIELTYMREIKCWQI